MSLLRFLPISFLKKTILYRRKEINPVLRGERFNGRCLFGIRSYKIRSEIGSKIDKLV